MNYQHQPEKKIAAFGSGTLKISQPDPPDVVKPPC